MLLSVAVNSRTFHGTVDERFQILKISTREVHEVKGTMGYANIDDCETF
jgi:hypothetical protein